VVPQVKAQSWNVILKRALSLSEINRGRIAAAQENPDVLAGSGL
jgi:hypothetical protein